MIKAALFLLALSSAHGAIFGVDNRENILPGSKWDSLARSTAVAVIRTNLKKNSDGTRSIGISEQSDLCPTERFQSEPVISMSCSGFLVGPDLLATAGHCLYAVNTPHHRIKNEKGLTCEVFDWVFGYQIQNDGSVKYNKVPRKDIYHCKQIIYAVQDVKHPFSDFALIQLDRVVKDRKPLPLATTSPKFGDIFHMIGNPFGGPTKITSDGRMILNNKKRSSFVTTLDAFEGNSGSAVFNQANEVVGILVAGTPSWNTYPNPQNDKCEILNRCDENAKNCAHPDEDTSVFPEFQTTGSEVQRISAIREVIKKHRAKVRRK